MTDVASLLQVIYRFQIMEPRPYHRGLIFWKPDYTVVPIGTQRSVIGRINDLNG